MSTCFVKVSLLSDELESDLELYTASVYGTESGQFCKLKIKIKYMTKHTKTFTLCSL